MICGLCSDSACPADTKQCFFRRSEPVTKCTDPIVGEIRKNKQRLAAKFGYDLRDGDRYPEEAKAQPESGVGARPEKEGFVKPLMSPQTAFLGDELFSLTLMAVTQRAKLYSVWYL